MNKIGIIGQGFVGNSIKEGMIKDYPDLLTYDINPDLSMCKNLEELVNNSDIIFVCVPTPMKSNGECYTGIVEGVLKEIAEIVYPKYVEDSEKSIQKIAVLKTTIPPGTSKAFNDVYSKMGIEVIFNPEFLTEANAVNDFKNQNRIVLGGASDTALNSVAGLYRKSFPTVPIVHMTHDEAEMVKYVTNTFLATKVIFANETYEICTALGIDYNNVVNTAKLDNRLGNSHWKVPGPDGDFGFGGHCVLGSCIVQTDKGPISIEKLWEGSKMYNVLSTNSDLTKTNFKSISEVVKRKYKGELLKIKTSDGELICTPDHLVPVFRDNNLQLIKASEILESDKIHKII